MEQAARAMIDSLVIDVLVVVVVVAYIVYGARNGLSRTILVSAGIVAGIVAAFFAAPLAARIVPVPGLRPVAIVVVAIAAVALGSTVGSALGRRVRKGVSRSPLSGFDRLLGALVTGTASALIASLVAFSVGQLGVPALSRAIAGSTVLSTIDRLTPDRVEAILAHLRSDVLARGIPLLSTDLEDEDVTAPKVDADSARLREAGQSVVRITGNAYACGQSQSGTGFIGADDRVITNAHVIAGVDRPVIETPGGQVVTGSVVYFDPIDDLAVIALPDLDAQTIPLASAMSAGDDGAIEGYPYGGPFATSGAEVVSTTMPEVPDIYGSSTTAREVYTLAAKVREGNSGGPLLTLDGRVAGVIFARGTNTADVGYAMTNTELIPVVRQAADLSKPVSSGRCIRG